MYGWLHWALLSAGFAALTAIFAKIGMQGLDADYATWFRTLLIAALLTVFVTATGKLTDPRQLPARALLFMTLSALATGASWLFYFRALQVAPASLVAPIDKLSVVLVAVFAFAFLGEQPSVRDWVGIGLIAAGVLFLAWPASRGPVQ